MVIRGSFHFFPQPISCFTPPLPASLIVWLLFVVPLTLPSLPTFRMLTRMEVPLVSPDFNSPDYYTRIKKALTAGKPRERELGKDGGYRREGRGKEGRGKRERVRA